MYGTHPFHWYFTAGIPALTGILFPVLVYDLFATWDRGRRNLWTIIACYVIAHSGSEHKEFRFLLPILPIICLLCGARIQNLAIGLRPSSINRLLIACAGLNLIAILYLGLVHQRAPIDVNRAILKVVAAAAAGNTNPPPGDIQVHYLMGCHSTPLLSHLHDPPTKFVPWFLDCSPKCRADPAIDCESDAFSKDPEDFMKRTYFEYDQGNETNEDGTCTAANNGSGIIQSRSIPDFVVCYSNDIQEMKHQLESMGMQEIGRFVNGVNGIRFGDAKLEFTIIEFLQDSIVLSFEEMILLQKLY